MEKSAAPAEQNISIDPKYTNNTIMPTFGPEHVGLFGSLGEA